MVLLLGGTTFAYKNYKATRPYPVWIPMPLRPDLTAEKQDELVKLMKLKLAEHDFLLSASKELGLPKLWTLPTDAACADELGKRLFVRIGDQQTKVGRVPTLDVGVHGIQKEREISEKISALLMRHVAEIIGIKPT